MATAPSDHVARTVADILVSGGTVTLTALAECGCGWRSQHVLGSAQQAALLGSLHELRSASEQDASNLPKSNVPKRPDLDRLLEDPEEDYSTPTRPRGGRPPPKHYRNFRPSAHATPETPNQSPPVPEEDQQEPGLPERPPQGG